MIPKMRRYIIATIFIATFFSVIITAATSGTTNLVTVVAAVITGFVSLIEGLTIIYDHFSPTTSSQPQVARNDPKLQIEDYLNGKLREFEIEERLLVGLTAQTYFRAKYSMQTEQRHLKSLYHAVELFEGRFVLTGHPGAGKSTILRELMRQQIRAYKAEPEKRRLPVWIDLGEGIDLVKPMELLKYWWDEHFFLPDTPEKFIKQNNLMLFIDDLDKLPKANHKRKTRANELRLFLENNATLPIIIACRTNEYKAIDSLSEDKLDLGLPVVQILELDDIGIQSYIARHRVNESMWEKIKTNTALQQMASNPYNLKMLIEVFKAQNELPENLYKLYEMYVHEVYRLNSLDRHSIKLKWNILEQRLRRLAYLMIVNNLRTSMDIKWVQRQIGQSALKDGISLGILIESQNEVRFYHETLQWFFGIKNVNSLLIRKKGSLEGIIQGQAPSDFIRAIGKLKKHGVPAVEGLISTLSSGDYDIRIAGIQALGEIRDPSALAAFTKILENIEDFNNHYDWAIGSFLGYLKYMGSPAFDDEIDSRLFHSSMFSPSIWTPFILTSALQEIGNDEAINLLEKAQASPNKHLQENAARALRELRVN